MANRLVALAPDTIRYHQKRVELAYRTGRSGAAARGLPRAGRRAGAGGCHGQGDRGVRPGPGARPGQCACRRGAGGARRAGAAPPCRPSARGAPCARRSRRTGRGASPRRSSRRPAAAPKPPPTDASFVDLGSMILDEDGPPGYPHADRSAGARGRGRAAGVQGDPGAVQARHRAEPRLRGLPGPLRPRHRLQGDGPARRGHRRVPEGAAGARGAAPHVRSAGALLLREGPVRHRRDGAPAGGREPGGWRRGQDRPALLAGPRGRGAGEGRRTRSGATSGRWRWTSASWT